MAKTKPAYECEVIVRETKDVEKIGGDSMAMVKVQGYHVTEDGVKFDTRPSLSLGFDYLQAALDAGLEPGSRFKLQLIPSQGKLEVETK